MPVFHGDALRSYASHEGSNDIYIRYDLVDVIQILVKRLYISLTIHHFHVKHRLVSPRFKELTLAHVVLYKLCLKVNPHYY